MLVESFLAIFSCLVQGEAEVFVGCAAGATAHHESARDQMSVHGLCQRCRRAAVALA